MSKEMDGSTARAPDESSKTLLVMAWVAAGGMVVSTFFGADTLVRCTFAIIFAMHFTAAEVLRAFDK